MPTSLLSADTMFPNFKGNETTEEKVNQIQNYLYMLVEQLRYSMANVGKENFNAAEFDGIVKLITEPVYIQLSDSENQTNLYIQTTAETLTARIEGVNKNLGETNKTVATLQASVNGFNTTVQEVSGKYTALQQTVNSIKLTATEDANGNTSSIILSGTGINASSASIKFKGEVTFEALENRGYITTGTIDDALSGKGYVTTTALEDVYNTTTINGAYIYTGTIDACTYIARGAGESFVVKKGAATVGGIQFDDMGESAIAFADKVYLYTSPFTEANPFGGYDSKYPSVKIRSAGRVSIEAPNLADPDNLNSVPIPGGGGVYILGGKTNNYGMGEGYITLESVGIISIKQGNTVWEFKDGSLFKNYNYTTPVIP